MDAGGAGGGVGGSASMAPGPIAAASVPVGGSGLGPDGASLAAMPAMSEHSRASRPHKRPAPAPPGTGVDMGPGGSGTAALYGGGGGGGAGDLVPRSMSHPIMGARGAAAAGAGAAGTGGFPHIDLQQQLNSLQVRVLLYWRFVLACLGRDSVAITKQPRRADAGRRVDHLCSYAVAWLLPPGRRLKWSTCRTCRRRKAAAG